MGFLLLGLLLNPVPAQKHKPFAFGGERIGKRKTEEGFGSAKMAANGARTFQFTSAFRKTLLTPSATASPFALKPATLTGLSPTSAISASRFSFRRLIFPRLPVELGGALSLMPLHSVTASALSNSLLSLHNNNWGFLSEGFATTL